MDCYGKTRRLLRVGLTTILLLGLFIPRQGLSTARAEVSIGSLGIPYIEDFDFLESSGPNLAWTNDSTLLGWYANRTAYSVGTGTSSTGALYSFGASSDPERALGSVASGGTNTIHYGVRLKNDTGSILTYLEVSYTGEQWRDGNNLAQQRLDFAYQTGDTVTDLTAGVWTDANALDFTGPVATTTARALNGNAEENQAALSGIVVVRLNPGQEIMLRWTDINDSGNDHGLAIDDLSVIARADPVDPAPEISASDPTSGAIDVLATDSLTLTFSEPVDVTGDWYLLTCSISGIHGAAVSGGPTVYTLDPLVDFTPGDACTLTIFAGLVSDQDPVEPLDQMAADFVLPFMVAFNQPLIHELQGAAHTSPLAGKSVAGVTGIVTALTADGFYFQEPDADVDADPATSEGIYVFLNAAPFVQVGDAVQVSGIVTEYRPGNDNENLSITEISSPVVVAQGAGNPLPESIVIGAAGRVPPAAVIEDDVSGDAETTGIFDPTADGLDFYESLEGMRVQVNHPVAVSPTNASGELVVLADNGSNAGLRTPRGGIIVQPADFNPERIFLDDEVLRDLSPAQHMPVVNVGAALSTSVTGVMSYSFGNYKLQLSQAPTVSSNPLARQTAADPRLLRLSVASFNVENLDPTDAASKFADLANLVVNHLRLPDLIALEEVQDNSGPTDNGVVAADQTLNLLIAAIQDAGGPTYHYRQVNPMNKEDGGEPGGNIRVAFLFRTDRGLSFVDRAPQGGVNLSTTPVTVEPITPGVRLSWSPGRIVDVSGENAFSSSRKPLVGEFLYYGQKLFVIANHFGSKSGDQPLFGRFQPPALSSKAKRIQQAQNVHDFVSNILTQDAQANVIVLGDLNDFAFSPPLIALKGSILDNLMERLPEAERYSYVFDGNAQALDHILVSAAINNRPLTYQSVHLNAEFAGSASDHDPQLATLDLGLPSFYLPLISRQP